MKRYHIKYTVLNDVLELLPERQWHDMLSNDVTGVQNRNAGQVPHVSSRHMFIDYAVKIIDVALTDDAYNDLRGRGITVEAKNMQLGKPCQDYDAPGPDPRFYREQFAGLLNFHNDHCRVYSADFSKGTRTEFYHPFGGGEPFSIQHHYDQAYETTHVVGAAKMIQPNQIQLGITKAWAKGLTGRGVKVCVIDTGYSGLKPHKDLDVPNSRTFNFFTQNQRESEDDGHATSMLSIIGARNNGGSGVIGNAYECELYSANLNNPGAALSWGAAQGCRVFNLSFQTYPDLYFREAVQKITADGGVVLVAAGNTVSVEQPLQPLCSVRDVVAVGGSIGGISLQYLEKFRWLNIHPNNGQRLRFVYPSYSVGATYRAELGHWGDYYRTENGTSPATAGMSGMLAQLMQMHPELDGESIVNLLESKSQPFTDRGVITTPPNFHWLR